MMNILMLAHRVPYPPTKGEKLRTFNILRYLSHKHHVHLVALADDRADLAYDFALRQYCETTTLVPISVRWRKAASLTHYFSDLPLTVPCFHSSAMEQEVRRVAESVPLDLVFIDCSSMAQYAPYAGAAPKVIDFIDIDSAKWALLAERSPFPLSRVYRREHRTLQNYERDLGDWVKHAFVVSEPEAEIYRSFAPGRPITAIQNGVDIDYFQPSREDYNDHRIVFAGAMDYAPNVDAVMYFWKEVLPLIWQEVPDATFCVAGRSPARCVAALAKEPNVIVTGTVTDIRSYITEAALSVAPLRIARGIQNKVLEAMALGVPVVATNEAWEGIDAVSGEHLFVADRPETFARNAITLMRDPDLRERFSLSGRALVEARYSWERNLSRLERILESVVGEGAGTSPSRERSTHGTDANGPPTSTSVAV